LHFQLFWHLFYCVSQGRSRHLRLMFHDVSKHFLLMRLARDFEHSAVSLLDHIVLVHEQTISDSEDVWQKFSSPCRDDQRHRRCSSDSSIRGFRPLLQLSKIARELFYEVSYGMITEGISFGSVVDVLLYPLVKYSKIFFLVLLPHRITSLASDKHFFTIIRLQQ
jgi:hypothetical protein